MSFINLLKNDNFIIPVTKSSSTYFHFYDFNFNLIRVLKIDNIKDYFLNKNLLLLSVSNSFLILKIKENILLDPFTNKELELNVAQPNTGVTSQNIIYTLPHIENIKNLVKIFSLNSFIYLSFKNGNIKVYLYNDNNFKFIKKVTFHLPAVDFVSDNKFIYLLDFRNKMTILPLKKSYDFKSIKIYFNKFLYFIEENRIFINSINKESYQSVINLIYEDSENIKSLIFTEMGGIVGIISEKKMKIVNLNEKREIGQFVKTKEIKYLFHKGNVLEIKRIQNSFEFKKNEIFLRDAPLAGNLAKNNKIKEKVVKEEEFDDKYEKGYKGINREESSEILVKRRKEENSSDFVIEEEEEHIIKNRVNTKIYKNFSNKDVNNKDVNKDININNKDINNKDINNNINNNNNNINNNINLIPSYKIKTNSFFNKDAHLFHFNTKGFMVSINNPVNNLININFHDNQLSSISIKDSKACNIGSFYDENYVISNKSFIKSNFTDFIEFNNNLVGINKNHVFAFDQCFLYLMDFNLNIKNTILVNDYYNFCYNNHLLAIFIFNNLLIIDINKLSLIKKIPCGFIDFCTFDNDDLYISIKGNVFILKNDLFIKIIDFNKKILTIFDNCIISLKEPIVLLPKPGLEYTDIEKDQIEKVKIKETEKYKIK